VTLTSYFYRLGKQIFGSRIGDRGDVADEEDRSNTAFQSGRRLPHSKTLREFRTNCGWAPAFGLRQSSAAFRLALRP
jgi:hypothetical protein